MGLIVMKDSIRTTNDERWDLVSALEVSDKVSNVEPGTVDSVVRFDTSSGGLQTEVLEILTKYGAFVDDAGDGMMCDWLAAV